MQFDPGACDTVVFEIKKKIKIYSSVCPQPASKQFVVAFYCDQPKAHLCTNQLWNYELMSELMGDIFCHFLLTLSLPLKPI